MAEKRQSTKPEIFLHKAAPNLASSEPIARSVRSLERQTGENVGVNAERKIGGFLLRFEEAMLVDGAREKLTKRFSGNLLLKYENISESYWARLMQEIRDNEGHSMTFDDSEKHQHWEWLQYAQRLGVESWTHYLANTENHYPTWFKVFALDGMTRLGAYERGIAKYTKRSKSTTSPYPQLDPAALAKTYDFIIENRLNDAPATGAEKQINSNNFNDIYSHFLAETISILPTPERAEDIKGQWRECESVPELVEASQGTPWCTAGVAMAAEYLSFPESRFHLFHLQGEDGQLSRSAATSIRMEDEKVVEVSGLRGGEKQYVEDSLIPTVLEKLSELPGGESYLKAYQDKQKLITMDRKFHGDPSEPFTIEELEFLYELHQMINYVDMHSMHADHRPREFKQDRSRHMEQLSERYSRRVSELIVMDRGEAGWNLNKFLEDGSIPIDLVLRKLESSQIANNLDILLDAGADINVSFLIGNLTSEEIALNVSKLLGAGADPSRLVKWMNRPSDIAANVDTLIAAGAEIDIAQLVSNLREDQIANNIDKLIAAGAVIDVGEVVRELSVADIANNLDKLLDAGADIDARKLVEAASSRDVAKNFDSFIVVGVHPEELVPKLDDHSIARNIEILLSSGADIDINALIVRLGKDEYGQALLGWEKESLIASGADPDLLCDQFSAFYIAERVDKLTALGVSSEKIDSKLKAL